jgi:hypothetical protein
MLVRRLSVTNHNETYGRYGVINYDYFFFSEMAEDCEKGVDFCKEWNYADICFVAEDKKLYANKMILSMWSPVFEAMFW